MPPPSGRSSRVPGVIGSMRLPDFYGRNIESQTRQNKGGTADFALCILGVQKAFLYLWEIESYETKKLHRILA